MIPLFKTLVFNRTVLIGLGGLLLATSVWGAWNKYKTVKAELHGERTAKATIVAALEEQIQKEQNLLRLLEMERQLIDYLQKQEKALLEEKFARIENMRETNEQIANEIQEAVNRSECVNEQYDPVVIDGLRRAAANARSRGIQGSSDQ